MFPAIVILILSGALFMFYLQAICQRILRRRFEYDFYQLIVNANRLEFPLVREALEEFDAAVDYPRFRMQLECDFLALSYLLKNARNIRHCFSYEERLLMVYFRAILAGLGVLHALGLNERAAVLKLASILEYFANVVGDRVNIIRFGQMSASEYLM
ncbi:MAG TPA: hypothetical protein VG204_11650 [Terriglobia bacterium]|nr:hypothetical protein [Terriglobia bacterium]